MRFAIRSAVQPPEVILPAPVSEPRAGRLHGYWRIVFQPSQAQGEVNVPKRGARRQQYPRLVAVQRAGPILFVLGLIAVAAGILRVIPGWASLGFLVLMFLAFELGASRFGKPPSVYQLLRDVLIVGAVVGAMFEIDLLVAADIPPPHDLIVRLALVLATAMIISGICRVSRKLERRRLWAAARARAKALKSEDARL